MRRYSKNKAQASACYVSANFSLVITISLPKEYHITFAKNVSVGNDANVGYVAVCCVRAGFRGGNANNSSNDGLGYVNVNNAVGNANTNNGARLSAFLYRLFDKIGRQNATYSNHRSVGGLMFRIGLSKSVVLKLKGLGKLCRILEA